ncbi:MAG: hypothetical protein IJT34_02630, partial [Butyrivibrio sp.]|nr:hypothetical protein [Butyrivibrio sp.]
MICITGILLAVAGCGMPFVEDTEPLPLTPPVLEDQSVLDNASAFLSEMSEMASEMASSVSVEDLSEPEEAAGESVPADQTQEQSAAAAAAETVVSEAQGLLAGMEELDIHDT